MCLYKVIILLVLVLFSVAEVFGDQHNDAETSFSGLEFEILLSKLELLQDKLVQMESVIKDADQKLSNVIKKQNEAFDHKLLSAINQLSHNFTHCSALQKQTEKVRESFNQRVNEVEEVVSKLSVTIGHSLSALHTQSKMIEQTVNTKQEQLYEKLQQLASKEDLARFKLNPDIYYQNISFPSCKANPLKRTSKYKIQPAGYDQPFLGYCEQNAFEGGWLVIQYRYNGSVDFYRNWDDYRNGFGSVDGEFWLGLEHLHQLTSARPHELLVELKDFKGTYMYARFSEFEIGSEDEQYPLVKLGTYTGTAGYSFTGIGEKFTTKDRDNDACSNDNCAEKKHGAWWYSCCTDANLNGRYRNEGGDKPIYWYRFREDYRGLSYSRMLIREK